MREKVLTVGELLITANPFRFQQTKDQYIRAANLALKNFESREKLTYKPKINFSFPLDDMESACKNLIGSSSMAIVGFLYSDVASRCEVFAEKEKILYVSPVSPLPVLQKNIYTLALGVTEKNFVLAYEKLAKKIDLTRKNILFVPVTKEVNGFHRNVIKSVFKIDKEVSYLSSIPEVTKDILEPGDRWNVFMAGSGYEHADTIAHLGKIFPQKDLVFIGNHRWPYCKETFQKTLGSKIHQIFTPSDFIDFPCGANCQGSDERKNLFCRFQNEYTKNYGLPPEEPLVFAIYDAVHMMLIALNDPKVTSREDLIKKVSNFSYRGTMADYKFENGVSNRVAHLLKWEGDKFIEIHEDLSSRLLEDKKK